MSQGQAPAQGLETGGPSKTLENAGLCVLALDGGGVRGLSSLYILRSIMERVNRERKNESKDSVEPYELFDLICGTSTGGLIAIMLGRLRMTVEECIEKYNDMCERVFANKGRPVQVRLKPDKWYKLWSPRLEMQGAFDHTILEACILETISGSGHAAEDARNTPLNNDPGEHDCKVFVCATKGEASDVTARFRSYDSDSPDFSTRGATILQAARATSAAPGFFEPVVIDGITFYDGGLGANNPSIEAWEEIRDIWKPRRDNVADIVSCFISIGCGDPGLQTIEKSAFKFLTESLANIATETNRTARKFHNANGELFREKKCMRFNVEQGLQSVGLEEYKERNKIKNAAEVYITTPTTIDNTYAVVERLAQKQSPLSTVPFRRDPDYVQRGSLFDKITSKLASPAARVALVGLGGVGKSQLAIEYAHQLRQRSPETWVLWIYASNAARFEQSVRDNLDQLKVHGRKDPKADAFQLFRVWLRDVTRGPWLIILDNADDAGVLESPAAIEQAQGAVANCPPAEPRLAYVPQCDHGKVLITSRDKEAVKHLVEQEDTIQVDRMGEDEALKLLDNKLGQCCDEQDGIKLAKGLDFMPLALTQATAYIRRRAPRCSIQQYLKELENCEKSRKSVLDADEGDLRRDLGATNSIILTWQISFDYIVNLRPSAADLLSLMSLFDRHAIPEKLLHDESDKSYSGHNLAGGCEKKQDDDDEDDDHDSSDSETASQNTDTEPGGFEGDVQMLRNLSFISITADETAFEMHRLVQISTQRWLKSRGQIEQWKNHFITNLDNTFPLDDHEHWADCELFFPHAVVALNMKLKSEDAVLHQGCLLNRSGLYAMAKGRYTEAEKMSRKSLKCSKLVHGEGHPDALWSMGNLAMTYWNQGRREDAEELQVEVMEKSKEAFGEGHPDTLTSMNNLAMTYFDQGRWEEAEELQVQVMEKSKEVLGEGHPSMLTSMGNLAMTYLNQGRWEEAEKLQMEVMERSKESLGEGHPSTLKSMGNLAMTYLNQGRWEEAEKLQVVVMEKSKEVLGQGQPDTLTSMGNLAMTYLNQGRWEEAEELQVEVMEKSKEALGEGHPDTLKSMGNLAMTYLNQGRREEAEELQVEVTEKSKEALGEGHPSTLTSMGNLAMTYSDQGQWEEAEKLEVEVMEKSKEVLGEGHPSTLKSMGNLAMTYLNQGRWEEAEELQVEAMEKSKEALGEGHPDTLKSMNNLAGTYFDQGRCDEAEKLQMEVMEKNKEALGEGHPDTLTSMGNLASTYLNQGRWEEAEKLQVVVMEKSKEVLGQGHPDTLLRMGSLAVTYWNQGRWEEAEKLQVEAMEKSKESLGEGHPSTLKSMGNLAMTYLNQGRREEAEELQVEVMERSKEVLGEGHPSTLTSMGNLAMTYLNQGRWEEAEELQVEAMEKSKEALGEGHPDTLKSMNNLAGTYFDQGRCDEAEKLQMEVMERSKEALGEGHPDTLTSMGNLAFILKALGRRRAALDLISFCADMSQASLGFDHPVTVAVLHSKTQWEAEETSDELALVGEEEQGGGGVRGTNDGFDPTRREATEGGSTWNQPRLFVTDRFMRALYRSQQGMITRACGSARRELETSYVAMESRRSSESQSASPHRGSLTQVLSVERVEKRLYAALRDGTLALPPEVVHTNQICHSKRHRSALGKQLQLAEPEAFSRNGSSGPYNRNATTANSH
ncbi:hypothetical protein Q7P35_008877 [Cladosporium inversicolor]